jgi:tripartite-type tricarboxylate transporter receptor subunit TctC
MSYLVGPKGLPEDVAGKLRDIFGKAIQSPAYQEFAAQYGMKVTDLQGDALQKEAVAIQETFNTVAPKIFVAK